MTIEFIKVKHSIDTVEVIQIYQGRRIYKGTIGKQHSGLVIYDGLSIEDMEQILNKMKEIQGVKPENRGVQIGNNNTQINTFK